MSTASNSSSPPSSTSSSRRSSAAAAGSGPEGAGAASGIAGAAPAPSGPDPAAAAEERLDYDVDEGGEDEFEAVDMDGHRPGHVGIHQNVRRDAFHNEHNVYHGTVQMGGSGNQATEKGRG